MTELKQERRRMNAKPQISGRDDIGVADRNEAAPRILITSDGKRALVDWRELWAYREVFYALIRREIKIRYAQTAAGATWVILQPVLTTAVLALLAGRWLKVPAEGLPYTLFALTGLIPWAYFNHTVTKSSGCLISTGLISKAYFPRLLLLLAAVSGGLIDMFVSAPVLVVLMIYYRTAPALTVLLLPLCLLLVMMAAVGAGIWVAVLNLYYRDVMHALPFATQLVFFLTPAAYPITIVPAAWRLLYSLNPMVAAIECWRWALFGKPLAISLAELTVSVTSGLVVLLSGLWYFSREEPVMADVGD
jgi:lipopolysaccharide transport system permease protein